MQVLHKLRKSEVNQVRAIETRPSEGNGQQERVRPFVEAEKRTVDEIKEGSLARGYVGTLSNRKERWRRHHVLST
jgi:hypothetical protein